MDLIERKDLVVGEKYFFDDTLTAYGVLVKRNEATDETSFRTLVNSGYLVSPSGLVEFYFEGDGFYPYNND